MNRFLLIPRPALLLGLFLLSSLALSFSGLLSSRVNAVSDYDGAIRVTPQISLISTDGTQNINVSNDQGDYAWFELVNNSSCSTSVKEDLLTALGSGSVIISQQNISGADDTQVAITYNTTPNQTILSTNFHTYPPDQSYFNVPNGQSYIQMYIQNNGTIVVSCGANTATFSTSQALDGYYNSYIYYSTYDIQYPSGYVGDTAPEEPSLPTYPSFGYTLDSDKKLIVNYLRNLDLNIEGNTGYTWRYTLYNATEEYEIDGEPLETAYRGIIAPYNYQFDTIGKYILEIDLQVTPPAALRPEIKQVVLKLNANGQFMVGSTDNCAGGICEPPETNCDIYLGGVERMSCMFTKTTNIGVLNPSINAFKGLFSSVIVSETPSCEIPISDITISGSVFPLSDLDNTACESTTSIHTAFPVLALALNFITALGIFYLIGRLINKLTDNTDHKVVEGIS